MKMYLCIGSTYVKGKRIRSRKPPNNVPSLCCSGSGVSSSISVGISGIEINIDSELDSYR